MASSSEGVLKLHNQSKRDELLSSSKWREFSELVYVCVYRGFLVCCVNEKMCCRSVASQSLYKWTRLELRVDCLADPNSPLHVSNG